MKKAAFVMTLLMAGCLAAMLFYYSSTVSSDIHIINHNSYGPANAWTGTQDASQAEMTPAESESIPAEPAESTSTESISTEPAESIPAEPVEVSIGHADFTPERLIFIGDGRTMAMYDAAQADQDLDIRFVSTSGADLNWLNRSAFDTEYQYINSRTAVIVMLGISDMQRAEDYVRVLNEWGEVFTRDFSSHFYFASVNPVDQGIFTNEQIESFNEIVKTGLSDNVGYIDSYSALTSMGYETTDTLHYTDETTRDMYELFKTYFNWE